MRPGDEAPDRKPPPWEPPLMWEPPPPPPWKPPLMAEPPPPWKPPPPPPCDPPPRCANAGIAAHANRIIRLKVNFGNFDRDISRPPLLLRKTCGRVRGVEPVFALHRLDSTSMCRVASSQFSRASR